MLGYLKEHIVQSGSELVLRLSVAPKLTVAAKWEKSETPSVNEWFHCVWNIVLLIKPTYYQRSQRNISNTSIRFINVGLELQYLSIIEPERNSSHIFLMIGDVFLYYLFLPLFLYIVCVLSCVF